MPRRNNHFYPTSFLEAEVVMGYVDDCDMIGGSAFLILVCVLQKEEGM